MSTKSITPLLKHILTRFRRDLRLQLMAFYILFVGPVVVIALIFTRTTTQRLQTDVKESDLAIARSIAQETELNMSNARRAVEQMADYAVVLNADLPGMGELFNNTMSVRPDINLVYRLNAQGFMIFHFPTSPGYTVGQDFSFREYFQRARVTTRSLISKGRISPTTQQPVATAVMPLWDKGGDFLGVVATNIKLESLSQTLEKIIGDYQTEGAFRAMIIDSSKQIIAHPDIDLLLQPVPDFPPRVTNDVLLGRSGNFIGDDEMGEETLFSYTPIPSAGWGVIIIRPTASAFATSQAFTRGILSVIAIFLGVGIAFWFILSKQLIEPLDELANFSQAISQHKVLSNEERNELLALADRPDQAGYLTSSLLSMEEAIDARIDELGTLLQTSAAVVSSLEHGTVLGRILEQVENLLDAGMSAIVAFNERQGAFRVQASRGLSENFVERINLAPDDQYSVTMQAIHAQEPIQISDTENEPDLSLTKQLAREAGCRSLLTIPLKTQYAPPSVLLIFRLDPHTFTEQEITLLTNFANQAAMAIENAELYSRSDMRLQEQTRRLEALIQSMHDGLIMENPDGQVVYANRRICELAGMTPELIAHSSATEVVERILEYTTSAEKIREEIFAASENPEEQSVDFEIFYHGRQFYLRLLVFNVTDLDGIPIGRGQIYHDITVDRELDAMKSRLVSTVSHELRTPLATIKGYATTLLADDVEWDPKSQREFLKIISDETDWLSALVTDLLDLSKIESGSLHLRRTECNLKEIIDRAAQRAYPRLGERLSLDLSAELPILSLDERLIESVFRNLIENASKYAGDSSPIHITTDIEAQNVVIRVQDEGPGIPVEQDQHIFESFYRSDNINSSTIPGVGLGLSICRGFIQAHGGEIWVEPCANGACIAFSLPLRLQDRQQEQLLDFQDIQND
jgi:PAS domain S-box-containing protein